MTCLFRRALVAVVIAVGGGVGLAQISGRPEFAFPATDGAVRTAFETNGILYIGGTFRQIGPFTGGFVPLSPTTGSALASVPYVLGTVQCSITDQAGGVYLGGSFKGMGSLATTNLGHLLSDGSVDSGLQVSLDGEVLALARSGDRLFVGGNFLSANGESRARLAAIDLTSHQLASFALDVDGSVRALAVSGNTLFIGGNFNHIGGQARRNLASVNLADNSVTAWNPVLDSPYLLGVGVLLADDGRIYAAGDFTKIGAVSRNSLAAFDANSGDLLPWDPQVNATYTTFINALAASSNTVYIGGAFDSIAGQPRNSLAAADKSTGVALPWAPYVPLESVYALAVSGDTVYLGGNFPSVATNGPARLAAVDAISGEVSSWTPAPAGTVSSLLCVSDRVYAGGAFSILGGVHRNFLAAIDLATGQPTSWDADLDGIVAGAGVYAMGVSSNRLFLGGNFRSIAGQKRSSLGAVDLNDGSLLPFNPASSGSVLGMQISGTNMVVTSPSPVGSPVVFDTTTGQRLTWDFGVDAKINCFVVRGETLYLGGLFRQVNGQPRSRLAAYDMNTRQLLPWNPTVNGAVTGLFLRDHEVMAIGAFSTANDEPRNHIAVFDSKTGSLALGPTSLDAYDQVRSVTATPNALFVAGDFSAINDTARNYFAALDPITGQVMGWDPAAQPQVEDVNSGQLLAALGDRVILGGHFGGLGDAPRTGLASFAITNSPPVVQILSPTNGVTVHAPAVIPLEVATTSTGFERTDVFVDTSLLLSTDDALLTTNWVVPKHAGDYLLTAVSHDASGQTAISSSARVTVMVSDDYVTPTLSLLSPLDGAIYPPYSTIVVEPSITAPKSAVELVQFRLNSNTVTTLTNAPFSVVYTNMAPGTNMLTVWLQDEFGVRATNGPLVFRINRAPQITLLKPVNGVVGLSPINLEFYVKASDADGFVRNVTYVSGSTVIGTATNAPFNLTFTNALPGNYSFQAIATDDFGSTSTSAVARVTLNVPPPLLSTTSVHAGDFRFTLSGNTGVLFQIEASTNLVDWLSLTNFLNDSGSSVVSDAVTNGPYRFYRARWLPF